jgi:hypothetical protein
MKQLVVHACILWAAFCGAHLVQRQYQIFVGAKQPTAITVHDAATGWWHWIPKIWDDLSSQRGK